MVFFDNGTANCYDCTDTNDTTMRKSTSFLYQEIAESLRRRIAAGELRAGDKLPPVRHLARQWDCTPGTVSRAYAILTEEGLVMGQRGGGTHVLPHALQPKDDAWHWAELINRADRFLLEVVAQGHAPAQVEAALSLAVSRWRELQQQERPSPTEEPAVGLADLRLAGSHDLAIGLLARFLTESEPVVRLETRYVGSLGGLIALVQGEADVAGAHLWDESTDSYNLPYILRLLPGRRVSVLTLAHRSLGLMMAPGNPAQVYGVADLKRPNIRLMNRQPGSGTRVWLDARLSHNGIAPESLAGYEREEVTHMAVAQAIARGEADVGLGIHAAATAYGLDFTPLTQERYDLVFPEAIWRSSAGERLAATVRSQHFREAVTALGGYDTAATGQEIQL